ncbi:MAG: hypothetical protein AAF415_01850 [Pseudomonadota bacterium]
MNKRIGLLGAAFVLALGACAQNTATEAGPDSGTTATGSGGAASTGAAAQQANPNWLDLSACNQQQDNLVHYQISGTAVALPQQIVRRLVLVDSPETAQIDRQKPLAAQLARGTGCPDKPLPIGGVITDSEYQSDLLEGNVSLFATPTALLQNYGQLITDLQDRRPSNACQPPQGDLILCFGQENLNGEATDILYIITADKQQKLNFGAPLFTRCEIRERKPVGCNLGDLASPEVFFDATLARLPTSTADLRAAHNNVMTQFAGGRRQPDS